MVNCNPGNLAMLQEIKMDIIVPDVTRKVVPRVERYRDQIYSVAVRVYDRSVKKK